jgi:nucleotide-binding universal stress UspA family protein
MATDFGPYATKALDLAVSIAVANEAALSIVHVIEFEKYAYAASFSVVDLIKPLRASAEVAMKNLVEQVRATHPRTDGLVIVGIVWEEVLTRAKAQKADLIVVGTHGRRGLSRALLGSVAEKVVRLSPVPVLTARGGE